MKQNKLLVDWRVGFSQVRRKVVGHPPGMDHTHANSVGAHGDAFAPQEGQLATGHLRRARAVGP